MNLELNQDEFCLKPKQVLRVHSGAGHTIVCHSGSVWVTQQRDRRDIILSAGESFVLDRAGLALVQALAQSAIGVVSPARQAGVAVPAAWPGQAVAGFARGALRV